MSMKKTFFAAGCALLITTILWAADAKLSKAELKALKKSQPHFQTSDRCFACHNNLFTASGENVSIGLDWRASMMANSSRDPYWQASVRRESMEHPESQKAIEHECSICHMPMANYEARLQGKEGEVFSHLPVTANTDLAADGVSCSLCHQISKDKLGTRESLVGGFVIDTTKPKGEKVVYGPYKVDDGHSRIMRTSSGGWRPNEAEHIRSSELCATCHTLITKTLGPGGKELGSFPEQMPYQEWLHSDFANNGGMNQGTARSCQNCHMPEVKDVAITRVLGETRETLGRHTFTGANFFMQRMLNKYRGELGVWALPQELEAGANRTVAYLQEQAARVSIPSVEIRAGRLEAIINVQNLGGHKFPTGYPSRRTWLHVTVKDNAGKTVFQSGALNNDGSITGNDNDADALKYEPHYLQITSPDQVQIYEAIIVDPNNVLTTGLLNAAKYVKDNRLLPRGFNKVTADAEVATVGDAMNDSDFTGDGDHIRYSFNFGNAQGPFHVTAELLYQPTAYRWANNLRKFDAFEPKRFVGYYDSMAAGTAVVVARAER